MPLTVQKRIFRPLPHRTAEELQAHLAHVVTTVRRAWGQLVQSAITRGFVLPIRIRVVDSRWATLDDAQVMSDSDTENSRMRLAKPLLPIRVICEDARHRIARVRIGRDLEVNEVEFLN